MTLQSDSTATIAAKLPAPPDGTAEALFTTTASQLAGIKACPDFAKEPAVQAVAAQLDTDNTALGAALSAYDQLKAQLPGLRSAARKAVAVVRRDRHNMAGTLTSVSGGAVAQIQAWGAEPSAHELLPVATTAPAALITMVSKTPGTVKVRCTVVSGAASYLWSVTADGSVPAAGVAPVITTGSRVTLPGQVIGDVIYVRVAVVRRRGGQSVWSDALQIMVR